MVEMFLMNGAGEAGVEGADDAEGFDGIGGVGDGNASGIVGRGAGGNAGGIAGLGAVRARRSTGVSETKEWLTERSRYHLLIAVGTDEVSLLTLDLTPLRW